MVVDTSAILAILKDEPEGYSFRETVENAGQCLMSAASLVEASIVIERSWGYAGVRDLDEYLATEGIRIVPVDEDQARLARDAFHRYGKGRHRAGLNFGDCFSYALAQTAGLPLLFKGQDFSQTDIEPAL